MLARCYPILSRTPRIQSLFYHRYQERSSSEVHREFVMQYWLLRWQQQHYAVSIIQAAGRHASLVALKLADALLHLLIRVDAETLVLGDAGQLHILGIELLLHDLLKSAEGEGLSLLQGQAPVRYISTAGEQRK